VWFDNAFQVAYREKLLLDTGRWIGKNKRVTIVLGVLVLAVFLMTLLLAVIR